MSQESLKTAVLSEDEIRTIITEIEATLNARPLTYVHSEQMEDILTPSHHGEKNFELT